MGCRAPGGVLQVGSSRWGSFPRLMGVRPAAACLQSEHKWLLFKLDIFLKRDLET